MFQGPLVACLMGLLQLLDEYHYKRLWEEHGERKSLKELLLKVFFVFMDLVRTDVFSPDWLVMKMLVNQILLESLQELAQPLVFKFLEPSYQFDSNVRTEDWINSLNLWKTRDGMKLSIAYSMPDKIYGWNFQNLPNLEAYIVGTTVLKYT